MKEQSNSNETCHLVKAECDLAAARVREQYTQRMIAARQRQFPIGVHVWFLVGDKKRHGVVVGYGGDYWWLCDVVKVKNTATGTIREEKAYALELCEHCQING